MCVFVFIMKKIFFLLPKLGYYLWAASVKMLDNGICFLNMKFLYWNGQLVWTPALGLYLCVCGDVHVMSNVELRITSDCY